MKNHIICVIDRSGSMGAIIDEAINGFNTFLEEQRAEGDKDRLTFYQFDDRFETVCKRKKLKNVEPLSRDTFIPRGMTALNDAIGKALSETEVKSGENNILMILTDGHENASKEYSNARIKSMVAEREKSGDWTVIYVGPDVDAFDVGAGFGVVEANVVAFKAGTAEGTRAAFASASNTVSDNKS